MSDVFKNTARDNASVGAQIGRVDGDVNVGGGVSAAHPASSESLLELLAEIREELDSARRRGDIDRDSESAAREEIVAAEASLPISDEDSASRFTVAMKRARGLVEGLATLTTKVTEAITAVQGIQ